MIMKKIISTIILLIVSFPIVEAQLNQAIINASDNLKKVIKELSAQNEILDKEIQELQSIYDEFSERSFSPQSKTSENLQEYLGNFATLSDLIVASGEVTEILNGAPDSGLKDDYLLILEMNNSLNRPYDDNSNDRLIKLSKKINNVLPQHQAEFNQLLANINDFNYYMFELARLFRSAQENNFPKTNIEQFTKDEDAHYIWMVPYTRRMLEKYIKKNGQLSIKDRKELYNSSPDAFPDFK